MRRSLRLSLAAYGALLVAPAAAVAPAPVWPAVAVGAAVGAVVAFLASSGLDGPDQLLTLPRVLAGFALPLAWLRPAFDAATSIPTFVLSPWFVGALAVVPWFAAVAVASEWRTRIRFDELTELAGFRARQPPSERRQVRVAIGVVVVLMIGAVVVALALDGGESLDTLFWTVPVLVPLWAAVSGDGREVVIAEEGIGVDRQIHDWATVDGYELTDEALSITRTGWHRSTLSFDRADVDDLDEVTAALDDCLEERPPG